MNALDLIRLVLAFIILDIAHWSWWAVIALVISNVLWVWEYNSTVRELEQKYNKKKT